MNLIKIQQKQQQQKQLLHDVVRLLLVRLMIGFTSTMTFLFSLAILDNCHCLTECM